MAQAMYPYTFGIVSDHNGVEGRGIGTGVGIVWHGNFLIATAKHVIEDTPPQRLYYLLPQRTLQIPESSASADWSQVRYGPRHVLDEARIHYAAADLAVIALPSQPKSTAEDHFYNIGEDERTPPVDTHLGYFGYPAAAAYPIGENFAARPSHGFGRIRRATCRYDPDKEIAVEYVPGDDLDPHGFSGSGVWYSRSSGKVWSPQVSLAGVVTGYYRKSQILICQRVETLVQFLSSTL